MRRPARTAAQKQYDRAAQRLLTLRRAAVRFDAVEDGDLDTYELTRADLVTAAHRYASVLSPRERRRLLRG